MLAKFYKAPLVPPSRPQAPVWVGFTCQKAWGLGAGNTAGSNPRVLQRHCRWQEPQKRLSDGCVVVLSLRFVACATHKGHVKKIRFSRAILKGENIHLLTGFRFQVVGFFLVVVFLGLGSLLPQISTKEPLFWSTQR